MVNIGAAGKLVAEEIKDRGPAADTSHMIPPEILQAARAGGQDSATRCGVAEGRMNPAQMSRNIGPDRNELGDSGPGSHVPDRP